MGLIRGTGIYHQDTKGTKMAEHVDALEALGHAVVNSAFKVHKHLGPGLLESVYEHCLARELEK